MRRTLLAIPATLAIVADLAFATSAQVVRRVPAVGGIRATATAAPGTMTPAQRARLHVSPNHKLQRSAHTLFGTIVSMSGDGFALRLRNGRTVQVDATTAIANDDFSAPLFVGKMVSVDGVVRSSSLFAANDVFRTDTLDGLPADH